MGTCSVKSVIPKFLAIWLAGSATNFAHMKPIWLIEINLKVLEACRYIPSQLEISRIREKENRLTTVRRLFPFKAMTGTPLAGVFECRKLLICISSVS